MDRRYAVVTFKWELKKKSDKFVRSGLDDECVPHGASGSLSANVGSAALFRSIADQGLFASVALVVETILRPSVFRPRHEDAFPLL